MTWTHWAVDASASDAMGMTFVPVEVDEQGEVTAIVWGMMLCTDRPEGKLIGVVHHEGQSACDEWCESHPEEISRLFPKEDA